MATQPKTQQSVLPSQENLLLDYVHRLERHRAGRRAVHIHISRLRAENRRENHVRIAANSFETLIRNRMGQIFTLSNTDLFFVFKVEAMDEAESALVRIRFLFSEDSLLSKDLSGEASDFLTWYNIEQEYEQVLKLAQQFVHEERERRVLEEAEQAVAQYDDRPKGTDMTPEVLAKVEESLSRADLSNMMRRQSVCAIVGQAPPQPVFSELFISIADLRNTLLPDVNMVSSRWLFQHLTETLDRRMLSLLNKNDDRSITGDISINLNIATLLSQEFLSFDDNVKAGMRGSIVIELQQVDIFGDLGAYMFARDFTHERGYRICIDGLTQMTLPFIDRERLGADMFKIVWDPRAAVASNTDAPEKIRDIVQRNGAMRVILCRCDNNDAIEFGHRCGIQLFQGRHVETLLASEMRRRQMPGLNRQY
ncbi:MAG: hypothetical protein RIC36_11810 [Rhodospirillales bacterium]